MTELELRQQLRNLFGKTARAYNGDYQTKVDAALMIVYAYGRRRDAALLFDLDMALEYWTWLCEYTRFEGDGVFPPRHPITLAGGTIAYIAALRERIGRAK